MDDLSPNDGLLNQIKTTPYRGYHTKPEKWWIKQHADCREPVGPGLQNTECHQLHTRYSDINFPNQRHIMVTFEERLNVNPAIVIQTAQHL